MLPGGHTVALACAEICMTLGFFFLQVCSCFQQGCLHGCGHFIPGEEFQVVSLCGIH